MQKKLLIFVGVAVIILLIIARKQGWIGPSDEKIQVETIKVERHDLMETVSASGKIRPRNEVKLAPEVSGEIIELHVHEGQEVERGKLLVKINPDLYQAAVHRSEAATSNARSSLSQSKAQYIEAEKNYKRNKRLIEQGAISELEFDASERAYEVARMGVEAAEFQIKSALATEKEARDNLFRTTIFAPQSGTVSLLNVEVGERVVGTAQMAGTELLRIADLENMQVWVEVNENDIIKVKVGDTAKVEVEAYPDREFKGLVRQVASSAKDNQGSTDQITLFDVRIDILAESYADLREDSKNPFRPGMTANVDIITQRVYDVLAVPVQSVTTRRDSTGDNSLIARRRAGDGQEFECVFIYEEGKARMQKVKIGIQDDSFFEITEGLNESEEVISGPYGSISLQLKNNSLVKK